MQTTHLTEEPRSAADGLDELVPLVDLVAVAGPPVAFIAVPWVLFGALLVGPFALATALTLAFLALVLVVAAVAALLMAPFLYLRHLRERPMRRGLPRPVVALSPVRVWPVGA